VHWKASASVGATRPIVVAAATVPATVKKNERRLSLRVVFIGDLFPFAKIVFVPAMQRA
jgi:hypothetical protein